MTEGLISVEDILRIHKRVCGMPSQKTEDHLIFGGQGILEPAAKQPYQSFSGQKLYPSPFGEAACLFRTIGSGHPFHNGNKRTAWSACILMLNRKNYFIPRQIESKIDIPEITCGFIKENTETDDIAFWLDEVFVGPSLGVEL